MANSTVNPPSCPNLHLSEQHKDKKDVMSSLIVRYLLSWLLPLDVSLYATGSLTSYLKTAQKIDGSTTSLASSEATGCEPNFWAWVCDNNYNQPSASHILDPRELSSSTFSRVLCIPKPTPADVICVANIRAKNPTCIDVPGSSRQHIQTKLPTRAATACLTVFRDIATNERFWARIW